MGQGPDFYKAALRIVRSALQNRINSAAQASLAHDILCVAIGLRSASLIDQLYLSQNDVERFQSMFHHYEQFQHLDVLSVGLDHIFIIHRELLLQDIRKYLYGSYRGLQRVFVNVDYRLEKPEVMPENRCPELEKYIYEALEPEIHFRIATWDQAEHCHQPLPIPDHVSLVTLTGWILGYPVIYVVPHHNRDQNQHRNHHGILGEDALGKDAENDNDDDGDDDDNHGRNCLSNQSLVVTRVQLEPTEQCEGLQDFCLLSFSYPMDLAEQWMKLAEETKPESPCTARSRDNEKEESDDDDEFVDASNAEFTQSDRDTPATLFSTATTRASASLWKNTIRRSSSSLSSSSSDLAPDSMSSAKLKHVDDSTTYSPTAAAASTSPDLVAAPVLQGNSRSDREERKVYDGQRRLPFSDPDICAAGRAFLHQLHSRFQKQNVWKAWEVGQQTVNLPVVAM
ncbi:hypothetical protein EDD11_005333 [Mortierella claussenii]|nr:hypothetical protein EDD11_005333 [Mortierella claussenii]